MSAIDASQRSFSFSTTPWIQSGDSPNTLDSSQPTQAISERLRQAFSNALAWLNSTRLAICDTLAPMSPVHGRRQIFTLIPESVECAVGKYAHKLHIVKKGQCYDPKIVGIAERACSRLAHVTDRKFDYKVVVVGSSVINAFCAPGGHIVVNRGLIEAVLNAHEKNLFGLGEMDPEDVVTAIMAHEMVHANARHSMRAIELSLFVAGLLFVVAKTAQFALRILAAKENTPERKAVAEGAEAAIEALYQHLSGIIANLWQASFSRKHENEADLYGQVYLHRAGIDPKAMVLAMQLLADSEVENPVPILRTIESWFRSHPHSMERAETCRKNIALIQEGRIPVSPTSAYQQVLATPVAV